MTDFGSILRGAVSVADTRVTPHNGTFAPEGVLVHHTATKGPGLTTVQRGRPDLRGPLCNLNLTRSGVFNVVSDGVAWHAGGGSTQLHREVLRDIAPTGTAKERGLRDDFSGGNHVYIGIEVDNDGVGEPAPPVQLDALVRGCAALCRHFGWSANRVIGHKEHTARKIDPAFIRMADLRERVAAALAPVPEEDDMAFRYRLANGAVWVTDLVTTRPVVSQKDLVLVAPLTKDLGAVDQEFHDALVKPKA